MNRRAFLSLATLAAAGPLLGLPKGVESVLFDPRVLREAGEQAIGLQAMAFEVLRGLQSEYIRAGREVREVEIQPARLGDHIRLPRSGQGVQMVETAHVSFETVTERDVHQRDLATAGRMLAHRNIRNGVNVFGGPMYADSQYEQAEAQDGPFAVRAFYAKAFDSIEGRPFHILRFDTLGGKA